MSWERGKGRGGKPQSDKFGNKNSRVPSGAVAPSRAPAAPQGKSPSPKGRPARPESRAASSQFVVEGMAALAEYAAFRPRAVVEIRCSAKDKEAVQGLIRQYELTAKLTVAEPRPASEPTRRSGEVPEDALAASRAPIAARVKLEPLDELNWLNRIQRQPEPFIVALDHVQDPRNLGAIARSAGFFGVRSLLVPERRQVLLTQASVATAQGGFALSDLVVCVNLGRALETLKEAGYWIIGADMAGEAIGKIAGEYAKTVLVLGNEETGLAPLTRAKCDRIVSITGARAGGQSGLESLNVSVAAGILMAGLVPMAEAKTGEGE